MRDRTAGRPEATLDTDEVARQEIRVMLRERANQPEMPKPTRKSALNEAEEAALGPALFTNPGVWLDTTGFDNRNLIVA